MNNIIKTTFLLSLLTILLVAMGSAVGGQGVMIIAFLMAAVMNFGSYWFFRQDRPQDVQRSGNHPRDSPLLLRHD
jgi:hypothetical protein